jgi:hypothetical protein
MPAKVRADLPRPEADVGPGHDDPELEAEVQAISAWFEALPAGLQSYLDHEARHGRDAYANT